MWLFWGVLFGLGVLFGFNAEIIPLCRVLVGGSTNSAMANMFISIMRYV